MLPEASLLVLTGWSAAGLICVGLGFGIRRLLGTPAVGADDVFVSFWIGWVAVLFGLQLWHLVLPVGLAAAITLGTLGGAGLLFSGRRLWLGLARGLLRNGPAGIVIVLAVLWLSNHALGGPRHGDSGAYFIPTIRWALAYPIVPGLGNLFIPYAFNQSYFLYVAALDLGPFTNGSHHLANSLLILVLLSRGLLGAGRLFGKRSSPADLFYALCIPVAVGQVFSVFLTSPSPDLAIVALGVVIAGELLAALTARDPARSRFDIAAITWIGVGAVTVKLSIAALAGVAAPLALLAWLHRERPDRRAATRTFLTMVGIAVLGFGPWIVRNVVLSGCPLFPSSLGALPVDWLVASDAVEWIRKPMQLPGPLVWIQDPRWFGTRLASLGWANRDVLLPLGIMGAIGLLTLGARVLRRPAAGTRRVPAVILVPTLASFAFTFALTPMPRYFGATLWVLAAQTVVLLVASAGGIAGRVLRIGTLMGAATLAALPVIDGQDWLRDLDRFETMVRPALTVLPLPSGLEVNVPRNRQCWAAELPCTPEPDPGLRLRREGDLGGGFRIDPELSRATNESDAGR